MKQFLRAAAFAVLLVNMHVYASTDWPIYKGNIYFTGNNDEIVVPNSNLKWLYQADARVYNPVVSDGLVFFVDHTGHVYCLSEETGRFKWKISMKETSAPFRHIHHGAGKVKYPLVKGNYLYITDPIAVYCINKHTGRVLWARTGLAGAPAVRGMPSNGIYSDPIIVSDEIVYGTRNALVSRKTANGAENWMNQSVSSYSAFPTYYDSFVITQSMDYRTGIYEAVLLDASTGSALWKRRLPKPLVIYPPVVYKRSVFMPVGESLYSLDIKTGETVWSKNYGGIISSVPGYTDRAVIAAVDNRLILVIDPADGSVLKEIEAAEKSSPHFVTVRDQLYIAYNSYKGEKLPYGNVRSVNFSTGGELWSFQTPFPGAVSQPAASGGILFLPAGNYIYAIGAKSYPRIVEGGSSVRGKDPEKLTDTVAKPGNQGGDGAADGSGADPQGDGQPLREFSLKLKDESGRAISGGAEVVKLDSGGRELYRSRGPVVNGRIKVPAGEGVTITAEADGYLPGTASISAGQQGAEITLRRIQRDKSYVVPDILFEFGKSYLKKESLPVLSRLADIMKRDQGLKIEVSGHTDDIGDSDYNQRLSERRADSVAEFLVKNGISPERIKSAGYGEEKPLVPNTSPENRGKNRRTEIMFR